MTNREFLVERSNREAIIITTIPLFFFFFSTSHFLFLQFFSQVEVSVYQRWEHTRGRFIYNPINKESTRVIDKSLNSISVGNKVSRKKTLFYFTFRTE